jgi:hypothetical protein
MIITEDQGATGSGPRLIIAEYLTRLEQLRYGGTGYLHS